MNTKRLLRAMSVICKQAQDQGPLSTINVEPGTDPRTRRLTVTDGHVLASVVAPWDEIVAAVPDDWAVHEHRLVPPMKRGLGDPLEGPYPAWRNVVPVTVRPAYTGAVPFAPDVMTRLVAVWQAVEWSALTAMIWNLESPRATGARMRVDGPNLYLCMPLRTVDPDGAAVIAHIDLMGIVDKPVELRGYSAAQVGPGLDA